MYNTPVTRLSKKQEKNINIGLIVISALYFIYKIPQNLQMTSKALESARVSAEILGYPNPILFVVPIVFFMLDAAPLLVFGGFYIYRRVFRPSQ
ncbi:MAG: hypothetical protein ACD_19C00403G0001 [uncultured bacterium]|nr:MAG: hypothetical protein ACD_19C00403G0001 [uncultured bacterium]